MITQFELIKYLEEILDGRYIVFSITTSGGVYLGQISKSGIRKEDKNNFYVDFIDSPKDTVTFSTLYGEENREYKITPRKHYSIDDIAKGRMKIEYLGDDYNYASELYKKLSTQKRFDL